MQRFFLSLLLAALCCMATSSCKKKVDISLQKSTDRLIGKWTVSEIDIHRTDTLGNVRGDSSLSGQGSITFKAGDRNAQGAGFFNEADFEGQCALSELVLYFKAYAAGDPSGTGGWVLNWDADPEGLRVQIYGFTSGGSRHRGINLSASDDHQELFYVVEEPAKNLRTFYTWKMSK